MKDIFRFSFTTGMGVLAAGKMSILHNMNYPLELIATSKSYDTSEPCVRDCVMFVNSQIEHLEAGHRTVIENNPFLAGTISDMDSENQDYHMKRWSQGELMKVHAADPDVETDQFPLSCSIFRLVVASGFEIEGSETLQ